MPTPGNIQVLTKADFVRATNYTFARRKNPLLLEIDNSLDYFHRHVGDDARRWNGLVYVGIGCCNYLRQKSHKDPTKRTRAVRDLMRPVLKNLFGPATPDLGVDDAYRLLSHARVEIFPGAVDRWRTAGTRAIRTNRGAAWHGADGWEHRLRGLDVSEEAIRLEKLGDETGRHVYHPAAHITKTVHYFDDAMRQSQRLTFAGQLWCKTQANGTEYPYSTRNMSGDAYAMDVDLNLYTVPYQEEGDPLAIHHSSFLAGGNALCAGMIIVDQGVLIHIDNNSGHYKPSTHNLLNLLFALRHELGQSLVHVTTLTKDGTYFADDDQYMEELSYFNAAEFLGNQGRMSYGASYHSEQGTKAPWWNDRETRARAGELRVV